MTYSSGPIVNIRARSPKWKPGDTGDVQLVYDVEAFAGEEVATLRAPALPGIPPGWFVDLVELSPGLIHYSTGKTKIPVITKGDGTSAFEHPSMAQAINAWEQSREDRSTDGADQAQGILRALNLKEIIIPKR